MNIDLGLFLLRLALGSMLVAHGWNKIFGSGGLDGTTRWFASLGLRPAWVHARIAALTELAVGGLVLAGLLTALTAAAVIALMTVAALTDHRGKGYFVFKGGNEYTIIVAMVALSLAALGPGAWSLDSVLRLDLSGAIWASSALVLGGVSALLLLAVCFRPLPAAHQP